MTGCVCGNDNPTLPQVKSFPDVFFVEYIKGSPGQPGADVYWFDYGIVAFWGEVT
jgi:hypothetical protein